MSKNKWNKIILSDNQLNEIKNLFDRGFGLNKMSKLLNINRSVIYKQGYAKLMLSGKERIPIKIEFSEDQLNITKKLFEKGYGARKIANELNITRDAAKKIMQQLGLSNIGRKIKKQISLPVERECRNCKIIKYMDNFYKRIRKNNLIEYSYNCISCSRKDRIYKNNIKRKNNVNIRLRDTIAISIWRSININNGNKQFKSVLKYLPYTINELKTHLESQFEPWMNWNNQGIYNKNMWNNNDQSTWTWQIDHIIPHSTFKYTSMEDESFKKCWALDNLRPYSSKQNLLDGVTKLRH